MPKSSHKQFGFQGPGFDKPKDCFGGSLLKNSHAKRKRPLDSKLPLHLVLRSARAGMRLPGRFHKINAIVKQTAAANGVRIYEYANGGNHLHLLIKLPSVRAWHAYVRALTGRIAQVAQGLDGKQAAAVRFWSQRPFTRIVRGWRRAYLRVKGYVQLNRLEAEGMITRREAISLRELRAVFADG